MANCSIIKLDRMPDLDDIAMVMENALITCCPDVTWNVGSNDNAVFFWTCGPTEKDADFDDANSDLKGIWWVDDDSMTLETEHKQRLTATWWLKTQVELALWATFGKGQLYDEGIGDHTPDKYDTFKEYVEALTAVGTEETSRAARELKLNFEREMAQHDPCLRKLLVQQNVSLEIMNVDIKLVPGD